MAEPLQKHTRPGRIRSERGSGQIIQDPLTPAKLHYMGGCEGPWEFVVRKTWYPAPGKASEDYTTENVPSVPVGELLAVFSARASSDFDASPISFDGVVGGSVWSLVNEAGPDGIRVLLKVKSGPQCVKLSPDTKAVEANPIRPANCVNCALREKMPALLDYSNPCSLGENSPLSEEWRHLRPAPLPRKKGSWTRGAIRSSR